MKGEEEMISIITRSVSFYNSSYQSRLENPIATSYDLLEMTSKIAIVVHEKSKLQLFFFSVLLVNVN